MTVNREAPGPKGHFLLGNLPEFGRDMLGFFAKSVQDYGDVVSLRLAGFPVCLLNHPDHFEYVLVTNQRNFTKHSFFWRHVTDLFGKGLLTSEGDFWLRQRRMVQPAFHRDRIASYGQVMVEYTERMLGRWREGEVHQIHQEITHLTMEIAAKTLFDIEITDEAAGDVGRAFDLATAEVAARLRRPFKIPERIPIPGNLRYQRAVHRLNELVYAIIQERQRLGGDRGDLLSMLIATQNEDGSVMSIQQLRDEMINIFIAAHETTAVALSWTLYLLSQHPEKEAKLVAELDRVPGGGSPTVEDIPLLPYTGMIIKEAMRLYPPAYVFGREAVADCEIGSFFIARGTTLFLSPWLIHRDKRFYENPEDFMPERWDEHIISQPPRYAYLPFGGGPRLCIGVSFAMMEMTLVLATIARKFKLSHSSHQVEAPFPSITLRPTAGMQMIVSSR